MRGQQPIFELKNTPMPADQVARPVPVPAVEEKKAGLPVEQKTPENKHEGESEFYEISIYSKDTCIHVAVSALVNCLSDGPVPTALFCETFHILFGEEYQNHVENVHAELHFGQLSRESHSILPIILQEVWKPKVLKRFADTLHKTPVQHLDTPSSHDLLKTMSELLQCRIEVYTPEKKTIYGRQYQREIILRELPFGQCNSLSKRRIKRAKFLNQSVQKIRYKSSPNFC